MRLRSFPFPFFNIQFFASLQHVMKDPLMLTPGEARNGTTKHSFSFRPFLAAIWIAEIILWTFGWGTVWRFCQIWRRQRRDCEILELECLKKIEFEIDLFQNLKNFHFPVQSHSWIINEVQDTKKQAFVSSTRKLLKFKKTVINCLQHSKSFFFRHKQFKAFFTVEILWFA